MAGLEFEPHNLYNLKIKNEETVAEVDSKWSSNYGSPLQSPPFEHWYFSMTFIVLCCTGIWGSSNRLCIGVCAKLRTRMKDGEHGVVLSTLVLAVATSVPGRAEQEGEGGPPRCEASTLGRVFSVRLGKAGVYRWKAAALPHSDSLKSSPWQCSHCPLTGHHTCSWFKLDVEKPLGHLLREASSSG